MTYEVKKKYAEQGRVQITIYENGQEKSRKLPLGEIGIFINEKRYTIEELIVKVEQLANEVLLLTERVEANTKEIEKLKTFDLM